MSTDTGVRALAAQVAATIKALRTGGETVPLAGTTGHVLTKTASGRDWQAPQAAAGPITKYELAADRAFSTTTYTDIPDWVIPLPANDVVTIDGIFTFHSAALTTGFGFAATPRTVGNGGPIVPIRFLFTFEYQSSATAWATATQTVPGTPMTVTTAAYVANSGILCRITGQIEMGATPGELHMQARTEVASSAITLRKGSPLRVM